MILGPLDLYVISGPGTITEKQYFTDSIPITSVNHSSFPNVSINFFIIIDLPL